MADFIARKVVATLPDPLEPDTLYFVRTGGGFDIRLTDNTGSTAHRLNPGWVAITQAGYDALDPPDPGTLYVIVEDD